MPDAYLLSLGKKMELVNERINAILDTHDSYMRGMMDWILERRGKQIRPRLALLSASFGTWKDSVLDFAASLEVLHMASLVHDDIIDDAPQRRGRASVYKRYGTRAAVYAGDYMIFAILSYLGRRYPGRSMPSNKLFEKMCSGELSQYENLYNTTLTEDTYLKQIEGKTASLFQIACVCGAVESDCDEAVVEALSQYGMNFGMMFQIQDDLLDILGADQIGKPSHSDIHMGVYTLPVLYTLCRSGERERLEALLASYRNSADPGEYAQITRIIREAGGVAYAMDRMTDYRNQAEQSVRDLPECPAKSELFALLRQVYGTVLRQQNAGA